MKIKTKLIFAFLGITFLSIFISSYIVINTINKNYIKLETEKIKKAREKGEVVFYDQLSVLKRKSQILSSFQEISDNINDKGKLYLIISSKVFLFDNVNIRILSSAKKTTFIFKNSESAPIKDNFLQKIPFLQNNKDPYLRKAGIFLINNIPFYIAISPIVDPNDFNIKGFLLIEKEMNTTFINYLKERIKTDIILYAKKGHKISSTIIDNSGKQFYLKNESLPVDTIKRVKLNSKEYFVESFDIKDYYGEIIGRLFILDNIEDMLIAQKIFYKKLAFIVLIISLFLIIIGLFLARKISTPILNLTVATKELSKGNFDIKVNKISNDEIGELTEIYNQMVESLKIQKHKIESLQKFSENIIKNLTIALIICDESLNINIINKKAEELFNIGKQSVEKNVFSQVPFLNDFVEDIIKLSSRDIPKYHDSIEYMDNSGKERILRMMFYKIFLEEKYYIVIQAEDITKRIRIEEKLTQANKLISIGELLSRFTHENSNIVSGILGNIELLKMKTHNPDNRERLNKIELLIKRSLELSDGILDFSRKRKLIKKRIIIREIVDDVIEMLKITVLKKVNIKKNYSKDIYYVMANEEKISVIIMNLLINSKDAIEEAKRTKGEIEIKISGKKEKTGDLIEIVVKDNGKGIEKDKINKIFDSYYTTKGTKGTGLGLSNVKDIVEENGGYVKVESVLNEGTSFFIYLPIIKEL